MHASDLQGLNAGLLGSICIIHTLYYYCIIIAIYLNKKISLSLSSANIIDPGTSFFTSSVNTSIRSRNRYWVKAGPWCSPTSTPKLLLSPTALRTTVLHTQYMYWTSLTYFFRHISFPSASSNLLHGCAVVCFF